MPKLIIILALLNTFTVYANDQASFDEYLQYAKGLAVMPEQSVKHASPESLPNFSRDPSQKQYMGNDAKMKSDAQVEVTNPNNPAKDSIDSYINNPTEGYVNPKSSEVIQALLVQANAKDIVHGHSNQYVDCTEKPTHCDYKSVKRMCEKSNLQSLSCFKKPLVKIIKSKYSDETTIGVNNSVISMNGSHSVPIYLPKGTKKLNSFHIKVHDARSPWKCNVTYPALINGVSIGSYSTHCFQSSNAQSHVDSFTGKWVNYQGTLEFNMDGLDIDINDDKATLTLGGREGGWSGQVTGSMKITIKKTKTEPKITIASNCDQAAKPGCHKISETCTEPGGTRKISGFNVYQACWNTQETYQCGKGNIDTCSMYEDQGCSLIGSTCKDMDQGRCNTFEVTYQCQEKQCSGKEMICGGDFFCINGDCSRTNPTKGDNQFGDAVSNMAAVGEAGRQVKDQSKDKTNPHQVDIHLFSGRKMECSEAMLGAYDCCQDSGWLEGLFPLCSDQEEKDLGKAKEHYQTIYMGEYCAKDIAGICLVHHKTYCVYDSKMARIINQYGKPQIGFDHGSAENPNCRGFTVQEWSKLNLSEINFYNPNWMPSKDPNSGSPNENAGIYQDIKKNLNLPDVNEVTKRLKKWVQNHAKKQMKRQVK